MSEMRKELSKLSSMEQTLNSISRKVESLETIVGRVEVTVTNCEKSCEFLNAVYEEQKEEVKSAKTSINSSKKRCSYLETKAVDCDAQKRKVQDKLNDLEARSMRENLLFFGIEETQKKDCAAKVKAFCEEDLGLRHETIEDIVIDRAHWIGRIKVGSIRPVVVKFHRYTDRELIRNTANDLRDALKRKNRSVKPQMPHDVSVKRKPLYSVFEAEMAKGNRCSFVLDKLYINGRLYEPPTSVEPPATAAPNP